MPFRRAGPGALVTIAIVVGVVGAAAAVVEAGRQPVAAGPVPPAMPTAVQVLERWDRQRAAAYSSGDLTRLRALYHPGSRTGRADEMVLAAWSRRGLRVHDLRMQLLAYDVGEQSAHRIELTVTDRMHRAVALGPRPCARCPPVRARLPAGQAKRRTITFLRCGGGWVIDEVRAAAPP